METSFLWAKVFAGCLLKLLMWSYVKSQSPYLDLCGRSTLAFSAVPIRDCTKLDKYISTARRSLFLFHGSSLGCFICPPKFQMPSFFFLVVTLDKKRLYAKNGVSRCLGRSCTTRPKIECTAVLKKSGKSPYLPNYSSQNFNFGTLI